MYADRDESIIRMSHLKMFLFFAPAFILFGLSLLWDPKPWMNMGLKEKFIFGGLAVLVVILCVIFPRLTYLKLSPEGLAIHRPLSQRVYAWNEVHDFRIVDGPGGTGIRIVCNLSDQCQHKLRMLNAVTAIIGYDLSLLDTYSMGAKDLVQTLNEWQHAFGRPGDETLAKT